MGTNIILVVQISLLDFEERNFTKSDINEIIEETLKNWHYYIAIDEEGSIDLIKLIARKYTGVDERCYK